MAFRDRAVSPAQGLGKKLRINKDIGPVLRVDTKRRPFNVAVKTADCITITGKVYSVANPTAIHICGGLRPMLGEVVRGMWFSGVGPLVRTASCEQYQ
jgi:hypothetical protein